MADPADAPSTTETEPVATVAEPSDQPQTAPRRPPKLNSLLLVDAAAGLAGMSVWAAADLWYTATGLGIAALVAVGDALFVGFLLTAMFHEWGHYAGARLSGAQTTLLRRKGLRLARFTFDFAASTPQQFTSMSLGGNLAHWGLVVALFFALPMTTPGQVALLAAAFGFAVSASVFELPVIGAVRAGDAPQGALQSRAQRSPFRPFGWVTIGSGAVLFAALI